MSKIIAVFGATGGQGGAVVNAFLHKDGWKVRGLTRNANSEKAKALSAKGVEVVTADLNDEATLVKALEGVSVIFGVTDFLEPFTKLGAEAAVEIEYKQGVNLAKAALRTPTLEHYIWSTLPDSGKISGGKFIVPHFVGKAKVDEFIKSQPELLAKTTFLWVALFSTNIILIPPATPHYLKTLGTYAYIQPVPPSTLVSLAGDISVNVGVFVKGILSNPAKTLGKYFIGRVEEMTNGEYLQLWSKATGKHSQYLQVSIEDYDKLFPKWGAELAIRFEFWAYAGAKSWSGDLEILTPADLGVEGDLVGSEKVFAATDWSALD